MGSCQSSIKKTEQKPNGAYSRQEKKFSVKIGVRNTKQVKKKYVTNY